MKIRVTKLQEAEGGAPAIPAHRHVPGSRQDDRYSLPIAYEVEGDINSTEDLPTVGQPFCMRRTHRNGVAADGLLLTTDVQTVVDNVFTTRNSVYKFQILD